MKEQTDAGPEEVKSMLLEKGDSQPDDILFVLNTLDSFHLGASKYPTHWDIQQIIESIDKGGEGAFKESKHNQIAKLFLQEFKRVEDGDHLNDAQKKDAQKKGRVADSYSFTIQNYIINELIRCKTIETLRGKCQHLDQKYKTEMVQALSAALAIVKGPSKCSFWKAAVASAVFVGGPVVVGSFIYDYKHDGKTKIIWDAIAGNPKISASVGAVMFLLFVVAAYCLYHRSKAAGAEDNEQTRNLVPNNTRTSSQAVL